MKINFILPCRNEEGNIVELYNEIQKNIKRFHDIDFNIYFIDDNSSDNSIGIINNLCDKYNNVKFIKLAHSYGKDLAIISAIENMENCDASIIMDADLQHPPNLVGKLIDLWIETKNSFCKRINYKPIF